MVGVWRYHEQPCGALVCIRVQSDGHILAFLCEEATLGPHSPQDITVFEMPFQPCASLSRLFLEGNTFTLQRLQSFMEMTLSLSSYNREAILQALHNIPISDRHVLRQSCYQRRSLRCNVQPGANWAPGECCFVCFEKPAVVQFRQCKHVVTCMDCAAYVKNCPQCRKPIGLGDRLMLETGSPGNASILLHNPIWIVKLSDWERVKDAFNEKKMFSTLAHIMLTKQTVF